jgi:hypothetical protein
MQRYGNAGGDSGVVAYEIGEGCITVQFTGGAAYFYDCGSAGAANIAEMHRFAVAGRGLNSFITRHVRNGYARKL